MGWTLKENDYHGSHEPEIAAYAKRQIVIRDGVISDSAEKTRNMNNAKFQICH